MAVTFESYERRIDKINKCLAEYGIKDLEDARKVCLDKGIDVESIVKGIQPIAFENAVWAYTVGCAVAIKKNCKKASDAAEAIGIGLQAFCVPYSPAAAPRTGGRHSSACRGVCFRTVFQDRKDHPHDLAGLCPYLETVSLERECP